MRSPVPAFHDFKQSRWHKRLLWTGTVLLVYVLVGSFVLPPITKRQAAVREVKFNPLVLSLTIRGLSLNEPEGHVFASWEDPEPTFRSTNL